MSKSKFMYHVDDFIMALNAYNYKNINSIAIISFFFYYYDYKIKNGGKIWCRRKDRLVCDTGFKDNKKLKLYWYCCVFTAMALCYDIPVSSADDFWTQNSTDEIMAKITKKISDAA